MRHRQELNLKEGGSVRCPYCAHPDSKVTDSREMEGTIRRRRECLKCGSRYTTYERVESQSLFVIKKDGRREEYDRTKLLSGIRKACEKRPLPAGALERMVDDIEKELYRLGRAEVPTHVIGEMVIERLRNLDHIAYIRFASVYREFRDLEDVRREVETLAQDRSKSRLPREQLPLFREDEAKPTPSRRRKRSG